MHKTTVAGAFAPTPPVEIDLAFENFTQTSFDPVQFLNETLPSVSLTTQAASAPKQNRSALLQNTSTEAQNLLARVNAHGIRASSELTTLTDEILRSGNRLAYEVEVLRGDANSLYDLLTDVLKDDIKRFVVDAALHEDDTRTEPNLEGANKEVAGTSTDETKRTEPDFIRQLRILGLIKARLESVIALFGEAMKWPVASADVSVSSLISVSVPEYGVVDSANDEKARQYTHKLRSDVTELLDSDGGSLAGLEAGAERVNELKRLVQVWKDTSEEKARIKVVENLSRLVEERKKLLDARSLPARPNLASSGSRSSSIPGRAGRIVEGSTNTAAGLFRKLRDEIYLE